MFIIIFVSQIKKKSAYKISNKIYSNIPNKMTIQEILIMNILITIQYINNFHNYKKIFKYITGFYTNPKDH